MCRVWMPRPPVEDRQPPGLLRAVLGVLTGQLRRSVLCDGKFRESGTEAQDHEAHRQVALSYDPAAIVGSWSRAFSISRAVRSLAGGGFLRIP